ncbi:Anti-sigma-K factor rskA [Pricia antarctica]|uniref:Anti-sigma-K factor rskA n=1 Tax=Pricia antarctica TaxID=641691 RepID=A0A1G7EKF7_9FLAO|nr:anti-sigma factor [Pricia antarctica]SDE64118.1 Anti-sigma-K factor rskA [Pricia antarctica]
MEVEKYITSGILELYVAGLLTEDENLEVHENATQYTEIRNEILAIEAAILELSQAVAPKYAKRKGFEDVKVRIGERKDTKVVQMPKEEKSNLSTYIGWAAAVIFAAGLAWFYVQNDQLKSDIEMVNEENGVLEQQIIEARGSLTNTEQLLSALRDKDVSVITLGGQEVSPDSYAKAYWNKEQRKVLIDAQGLPEPPDGMVYQVWSLKMNPLTPTSVGLLENFASDDNKIFTLNNPNESEAFGITLEPAGGSEGPTMEQLYTLGAVSSS